MGVTAPRPATAALCLIVVAFVAAATVAGTPDVARGGGGFSFRRAERCLMEKINKRRAHRGLRRLDRDRQLGYVARRHARAMEKVRSTWHMGRLPDVVTRWRRLGQTVGASRRCRGMFRSFMRSGTHRKIIMGRWRHMGVGAVRGGGRIWVMQAFETRRDPGNIWHVP